LRLLIRSGYFFFIPLVVLLFTGITASAQFHPPATTTTPVTPAVNNTDSSRMSTVQIIQGKSLREMTIDSGRVVETIAGDVILKENNSVFRCDSVILYSDSNTMEAFGNVHINQNDSIDTYSQYLRYESNTHMAYLHKDVKLTDKKGVLYTQDLQYDMKANIGNYYNGGKVVNGKTVLTSDAGTYYADTKDVYFKNNVHLVDPKYDIVTDSLLYNTQSQLATFITGTHIKSKNGGDVYTNSGTYDLKEGKAFFGNRSIIKDSTTIYVADNSAYDEKSGTAQLKGNAIIRDSVNGYTVLGNEIFLNKKNNSFLATQKPVLIFKGDGKDSTFIAADTLFSGIKKTDSTLAGDSVITDTLKKTTVVKNTSDTSLRYFLAFHHVRIFNDSLQAVCDSLYYSSLDSTFRLFQQPLLFANHSQIAGDTMYLYIKNKKADRLYVFYNGSIINKANEQLYNQMTGRTINGYFKNGQLDYIRVKGSPAQSVYYPQNNDSAYIGMNRSKGDVIDIYFLNKELHKVKFINDVDGTLYPMLQIPADQRYLKGFKWLDERRPKNKVELFE
jgi:lipopolysaccharide export system protein LptA